MLRIALLALSLALPSTLFAQYVSGSVVVLEVGGDYIVVAADSLRLGPGPGQVSHSACKIVRLGDQIVFAATGLEAHPGIAKPLGSNAWNVQDIAKQEYAVFGKEHTDQRIQRLAAAYGERLSGQINHDLKLEPTGGPLMTYLTKNQGGGAAVFAGFDEKLERVIVEVKVAIQSPGGRSVGYTTKLLPSDSAGGTEVLGDTAIAQELAAGRSQRAQEWCSAMLLQPPGQSLKDSLIVGSESVAEWTAKYDPGSVGGPIDVILVTRKHGVTWVRRKQSCGLVAGSEKSPGSPR